MADTDTDLCDIYIDGKKVVNQSAFNNKTHQIYSVIFRTAPELKSEAFIDNIKLVDEL